MNITEKQISKKAREILLKSMSYGPMNDGMGHIHPPKIGTKEFTKFVKYLSDFNKDYKALRKSGNISLIKKTANRYFTDIDWGGNTGWEHLKIYALNLIERD